MKKAALFVMGLVVAMTTAVQAANYIPKAQAQKTALNAIGGGGTIVQTILETEYMTRVWSVSIVNINYLYDVHVNAFTGKVMKIVSEEQTNLIPENQAKLDAIAEAGGGSAIQALLADQDEGGKGWLVTVTDKGDVVQVAVNGETSAVVTALRQKGAKVITRAAAETAAIAAVGSGATVRPPSILEMADKPAHWSVNLVQGATEYEVWVQAYTGKILNIIVGG